MGSVIFHKEKGRGFIEQIMSTYYAPSHLFAHVHHQLGMAPQQRFCPPGMVPGSPDHLVWLFGTTLCDYMSESSDVFNTSVHLWQGHPDLWGTRRHVFGPDIVGMSLEEVTIAMQAAKSTFPRAKAARLQGSFRTLYEELDGDPRNIFTLGETIGEIVQYGKKQQRKSGIAFLPGYGPKILSLLALHFYDFGVLSEVFPEAIPVDRHLQQQLMGCGVIELTHKDGMVDAARAVAEYVRPQLVALCKEMNVSIFDLAHAMWFTGTKLCRHCREWQRKGVTEKLAYCPVLDMCSGRQQSRTYQTQGKWLVRPEEEDEKKTHHPQLVLFN